MDLRTKKISDDGRKYKTPDQAVPDQKKILNFQDQISYGLKWTQPVTFSTKPNLPGSSKPLILQVTKEVFKIPNKNLWWIFCRICIWTVNRTVERINCFKIKFMWSSWFQFTELHVLIVFWGLFFNIQIIFQDELFVVFQYSWLYSLRLRTKMLEKKSWLIICPYIFMASYCDTGWLYTVTDCN